MKQVKPSTQPQRVEPKIVQPVVMKPGDKIELEVIKTGETTVVSYRTFSNFYLNKTATPEGTCHTNPTFKVKKKSPQQ
jgi:hypothetical protein